MVGRNLISTGVLPTLFEAIGDINLNGISEDNFVLEPFVYDGVQNQFNLANPALKVLMVYIDNGSFPEYVPNGPVNSVVIPNNVLFAGNNINIRYIIES